jgi:hypothetical protein
MFVVIDIYRGTIAKVHKVDDDTKAFSYRNKINEVYEQYGEESDCFTAVYRDNGTEEMELVESSEWSVVEVITERGNRIGIFEDVSKDVKTIAGPMNYEAAAKYCEDYCRDNAQTVQMYEGDCTFIDFAHYKEG